jgi:hypothetical protein
LSYAIHSLYAMAKFAPFPVWSSLLLLCTIGALYGLVCSALAIREPLKFK